MNCAIRKFFWLVMSFTLVLSAFIVCPQSVKAVSGDSSVEWTKSLGGSQDDFLYSMEKTSDGGYILSGYTYSNDGDVTGFHPGNDGEGKPTHDAWVVKVNSTGEKQWQKCIGGSGNDDAGCVIQYSDGYILVGYSDSIDGDLTGVEDGNGWIAWLDSTGSIKSQKRLVITSSTADAYFPCKLLPTTDGNYAIAFQRRNEYEDIHIKIVKVNPSSTVLWEKEYGGSNDDRLISIKSTMDGGLAMAVETESTDGNVVGHSIPGVDEGGIAFDNADAWFLKLDVDGNIVWQKCFGNKYDEKVYAFIPQNEGYIISYETDLYEGKISKLNNNGDLQWEVFSDSLYNPEAFRVTRSGYAFLDGGGEGREHYHDRVCEIDKDGKKIGAISLEAGYGYFDYMDQINDGGFILFGDSHGEGFSTIPSHGLSDFFIVKIKPFVTTDAEPEPTPPEPPSQPIVIPVGISCTKIDATEYGAANGSISISASGGNGSYEYSINNGASWQASNTFGGLAAATYIAAVRDAGNPSNTATCDVSVGQPAHKGVVAASKAPSKVNAGTALTLVPPPPPKGSTLQSTTFTSSNPSVATVDVNGNVTFKAGGKVTITTKVVSTTVDKKGKVKTKTTTVKKTITVQQPVASLSLSAGSVTITRSQKLKLTASIAPATASNKKVKWMSSNPKVVAVSGAGVVTGKASGTAVITCRAQDGSGASASCTVMVTPIYSTGIKMSKSVLSVKLGKKVSLKATVLPKTADFKTVTWTSSNPGVATVDEKGKVTAIAAGSAVITATTNAGQAATCTVTVP